MANRGDACSNTSQFFVTLAPAAQLDGVHPIFGEMAGGEETLAAIERVPVDERGKPLRPIVIEDVIVVEDPYPALSKQIEEADQARHAKRDDKDYKRVGETTRPAASVAKHTPSTIGKYIRP